MNINIHEGLSISKAASNQSSGIEILELHECTALVWYKLKILYSDSNGHADRSNLILCTSLRKVTYEENLVRDMEVGIG